MRGFEKFGPTPDRPKSSKAEEIEQLLPAQENRNDIVVNKLENTRVKGEVKPEDLEGFIEVMRNRIATESEREKTTLPKEKLQQLDEELEENPEAVKAIIKSFGYGVASDPFMLYGLIAKEKDLIQRTVHFYNVVQPEVMAGARPIEEEDDDEIADTLKEFWKDEPVGPDKGEFPHGDDISYYAGVDAKVTDEHPRLDLKKGPGYRYIFGPTRKNKTDYCGYYYPSRNEGSSSVNSILEIAKGSLPDYALQFRDNSDVIGHKDRPMMTGYPAEWYIPGSSKSKVLGDYFKHYLVPQVRKSAKGGIRSSFRY